jgi:hypothetical protein
MMSKESFFFFNGGRMPIKGVTDEKKALPVYREKTKKIF